MSLVEVQVTGPKYVNFYEASGTYNYDSMSRLQTVSSAVNGNYTRIPGSNLLSAINITKNRTLVKAYSSTIVFNLEDKPVTKTLCFRLAEIGLDTGNAEQQAGGEVIVNLNIPAYGHKLLHVAAKPNKPPQVWDAILLEK